MGGTVSDWVIEMQKRRMKDATALHSDKLEDYQRLKESRLPIFEDLIVPLNEFDGNNGKVLTFLKKYDGFVVRAIPNTKDLPRRYKIGVKSLEECLQFLRENVKPEDGEKYSVFLTEFEPQTMAGIIISRGDNALVEVAEGNLDTFSHGQSYVAGRGEFTCHDNDHLGKMRYFTKNDDLRKLLWDALLLIRLENDNDDQDFSVKGFGYPKLRFRRGYFEFVVTEKSGIKFLDYKVNEAYLVPDPQPKYLNLPGRGS